MAIGLKTQIWNNNLRSFMLLALYPLLLLAMLWAAGFAIKALETQSVYAAGRGDPVAFGNAVVMEYWPILVSVVAVWFIAAWFFQANMIRAVSHSQPVTRSEAPDLYNILENLCISRGMKVPRLEIIETEAKNAFASGISDNTYAITVTRGLLQSLQPDEVEAVLGHELSHIINRDVRLLMVTVIFTGMIGFAAQMLWSSIRHGLRVSRNGRGNGIILYLAILAILAIGYMASLLARMAISRSREYMADAGSVELTKNPEAMIRALQKIAGADRIPDVTDDVSMMCTENSHAFLGLFATHPPIGSRIQVLSEITQTAIPQQESAALPQSGRNPWA